MAEPERRRAVVIGGGFAGLSAACSLAHKGWKVVVLEKNAGGLGGRCRTYEEAGFSFDMGPSWYWMPEVFDQFFARFGRRRSDYYELRKLDPPYRVYFPTEEVRPPPHHALAHPHQHG